MTDAKKVKESLSSTPGSQFDEYKCQHLFLLVGTNPLPSYVSGKLLSSSRTHFYFVHSKDTSHVADRLITGLELKKGMWDKIQVKESSPDNIYSKIKENAKGKSGLGLDYTSGTKSMSVHAYRAIFDSDDPSALFSYLDARKLEMVINTKEGLPRRIPSGLSLKPTILELMGLHGYRANKPDRSPELIDVCNFLVNVDVGKLNDWSFKHWRKSNERFLSDSNLKKAALPHGAGFEALDELWGEASTLGEISYYWDKKVRHVTEFLSGKWLEQYTLYSLQGIASKTNVHESVINLEPKNDDTNFELDVVALKGYQLFVLSCTTAHKKSRLKQKMFEAYIRGRQLGGDEARIGLICYSNDPDQVKDEIEEEWDSKGKIAVFGKDEIRDLSYHLEQWFQQA